MGIRCISEHDKSCFLEVTNAKSSTTQIEVSIKSQGGLAKR